MQRLLQTSAAPSAAPELLQRLQPHGPVSALPHAGHAFREAPSLLLHPPADAVAAYVAIARGPRAGQNAPGRSDPRPGPGAAMARTGRPPPRRILPPAVNACAVDARDRH